MFDAEIMRRAFDYDPETGVFIRRHSLDRMGRPVACAGERADHLHSNGYLRISIKHIRFWAHRIAWIYMTGEWPPAGIDVEHRNGNRADNRWSNLRLANRRQNMANMAPRGGRTTKGVSYDARRKKWRARIRNYYAEIYLGDFDSQEAAQEAYNKASTRLNGQFARVA